MGNKKIVKVLNDKFFADLFYNQITLLRNSDGYTNTKMKKIFCDSVREWSNTPPIYISKKVAEHFIQNHPNINPFMVNHRPRNKYGIPVILEHTTPVIELVNELLETNSIDEVFSVMNNNTPMSIISKEEHITLEKMGFEKCRPEGWVKTYKICDIDVLTENEYKKHLADSN